MWTPNSIRALPNIDLKFLAGDMANAKSHGMNPYGDEAVAAAYDECEKRGINTIVDDGLRRWPISSLAPVNR